MNDEWLASQSYSTAGPCLEWGSYDAGRPTGDWATGSGSGGYVGTRAKTRGNKPNPEPSIQANGGWSPTGDGAFRLSKTIDDVVRAFGIELYDQMMTDDQVSSAVMTLVFAVLGGEIAVEPAIQLEPGETIDDPKKQADFDTANRAAELVRRSLCRVPDLDAQIEAIFTDGIVKGAGLADRWWVTVQGPNDDKPVTLLGGLLARPRESWDFTVDKAGRVNGVAGWSTSGSGEPTQFDRDRFVVYINSPRRGDPRGTSDLRPAYDPWNLKIQARPQRAKWVNQFANPTVEIAYDPSTPSQYPRDAATGLEDTTQAPYSAVDQAASCAANFNSSGYLVHPIGWEVKLVESKSDGGGFASNEDAHDNAIVKAICLTARAINGSNANSQADADAAQDVFQMKAARRRAALVSVLNADICKPITRMNLGDDAAERLCPKIIMRASEHVQAQIISAMIDLLKSGEVPVRFKPKVLARIGFSGATIDDFEDLDEAKKAAAQTPAALADQSATAADPAEGREGGEGDEDSEAEGEGTADEDEADETE